MYTYLSALLQYYDLAADVLAENAHLTFKFLTPVGITLTVYNLYTRVFVNEQKPISSIGIGYSCGDVSIVKTCSRVMYFTTGSMFLVIHVLLVEFQHCQIELLDFYTIIHLDT